MFPLLSSLFAPLKCKFTASHRKKGGKQKLVRNSFSRFCLNPNVLGRVCLVALELTYSKKTQRMGLFLDRVRSTFSENDQAHSLIAVFVSIVRNCSLQFSLPFPTSHFAMPIIRHFHMSHNPFRVGGQVPNARVICLQLSIDRGIFLSWNCFRPNG